MVTKPQVGDSRDTWGTTLNAALDDLQGQVTSNGSSITSLSSRTTALEGNNAWRPSDHNLLTWAFEPVVVSGGSAMTGGTVYLIKVNVRNGGTATNIVATVAVAGSTLTAGQCFAGVYNTSGTLLGATADQSGAWVSIGTKTMAISGGPLTLAAGSYYVALLANGTTPPQFQRNVSAVATASLLNVGLTASTGRFITADTAQTTLPASTNLASVAVTDGVARWVALS